MAVPAHPPPGYARRTPEQTVLYGALRKHAETFLADVETDPASSGLPMFVRGEVERFLKCGILAHGFVRVYCPTCKDDLLVGFSCKGRGLCPSCGARRMVGRLLGRTGLLDEDVEDALEADVEHPIHLQVAAASVLGRTALGPRAGRPLRAVGRRRRAEPPTRVDKRARRRRMQSAVGGFDLQAGVRIAARHRHRLEHLARYILRPAVSTERLKALPDGRFAYELRRPWADGTTGFLFDPHELMEKLVALIPLPRGSLVRYHGLFAPRAAGRAAVFLAGGGGPPSAVRPAEHVPQRLPWADLLRRVFLVDVLRCTRCGGRRRVLEAVTDPQAAARILLPLGLEATAPRAEPARAPPDFLDIAS